MFLMEDKLSDRRKIRDEIEHLPSVVVGIRVKIHVDKM